MVKKVNQIPTKKR